MPSALLRVDTLAIELLSEFWFSSFCKMRSLPRFSKFIRNVSPVTRWLRLRERTRAMNEIADRSGFDWPGPQTKSSESEAANRSHPRAHEARTEVNYPLCCPRASITPRRAQSTGKQATQTHQHEPSMSFVPQRLSATGPLLALLTTIS